MAATVHTKDKFVVWLLAVNPVHGLAQSGGKLGKHVLQIRDDIGIVVFLILLADCFFAFQQQEQFPCFRITQFNFCVNLTGAKGYV